MNAFVQIMIFGWPFIAVGLFALVPPRLAVLFTYLIGTLFLPQGVFDELPGLPDIDRHVVMSVGCLLGVLLFDQGAFRRIRFSIFDLPMLVWCLCPLPTSISNDLGAYDGFSQLFYQTMNWGLPYLMGRMYFMDRKGLRLLATAIVVGAVIYVPLCLWEIRMSPHLHHNLYGFHPRPFRMVHRYGGFRPTVFMQSALMVGMWLAAGTIVAFWGASSGALRRIQQIPTAWMVPPLAITLVLAKTTSAATLMFVSLLLFPAVRVFRTTLPLIIFVLVATLYPALRVQGTLDAEHVQRAADVLYGDERIESLGVRLRSEDLIIEKAMERPVLGWGGWGRYIVRNEHGRRESVPDALWFIALGRYGLVGLGSIATVFLLPAWLTLWRLRARSWTASNDVLLGALSLVVVVYWIDSLLNAMLNPVLVLTIGAIQSFHIHHARPARRRRRARQSAPTALARAKAS